MRFKTKSLFGSLITSSPLLFLLVGCTNSSNSSLHDEQNPSTRSSLSKKENNYSEDKPKDEKNSSKIENKESAESNNKDKKILDNNNPNDSLVDQKFKTDEEDPLVQNHYSDMNEFDFLKTQEDPPIQKYALIQEDISIQDALIQEDTSIQDALIQKDTLTQENALTQKDTSNDLLIPIDQKPTQLTQQENLNPPKRVKFEDYTQSRKSLNLAIASFNNKFSDAPITIDPSRTANDIQRVFSKKSFFQSIVRLIHTQAMQEYSNSQDESEKAIYRSELARFMGIFISKSKFSYDAWKFIKPHLIADLNQLHTQHIKPYLDLYGDLQTFEVEHNNQIVPFVFDYFWVKIHFKYFVPNSFEEELDYLKALDKLIPLIIQNLDTKTILDVVKHFNETQ